MAPVEIHCLWNLRKVSDGVPSIYVNSIPNYPNDETRNIFYTPSEPDLNPIDFGLAGTEVSAIFAEVASSKEYKEAIAGLPEIGNPEIHGFAIVRRVDNRWLSTNVKRESLHITLTPRVGTKDLDHRDFEINIDNLSGASRRTIKLLDGGTRRTALYRFNEIWNKINIKEELKLPQPERQKVFISYRHIDGLDCAKALHQRMDEYGGSAYFEPFLDLHELKPGEWEERILGALEQADIFMPVLTSSFASQGSFSFKELKIAKDRSEIGDLLIFPVLLQGHHNSFRDYLKRFQRLTLTDEANWQFEIDAGLDIMARS